MSTPQSKITTQLQAKQSAKAQLLFGESSLLFAQLVAAAPQDIRRHVRSRAVLGGMDLKNECGMQKPVKNHTSDDIYKSVYLLHAGQWP